MLGVPLFLQLALLPLLVRTAHQDSGIVNGKEAQPHSRPYMVSVQQKNRHACGGFLVSDSFVMTAAHCLKWGENLTVLLGAHDISEKRKSIWAEVKFYHIHPGYDRDRQENDIMLLQLKTAVQKSKEVQWIPLPKKDKDIKPKTLCSVAGWGAIKTNGTLSPRLLEVNVSVVDRKLCDKLWKRPITNRMVCAGGIVSNRGVCKLKTVVQKTKEVKWISLPEKDKDIQPNTLCSVAGWGAIKSNGTTSPRLLEVNVSVVGRAECQKRWRNIHITSRMMCAGGSNDNKGFCTGDSGGPLVCSGEAVGIVSFNNNYTCTYPNLPNVYTQISNFLPWIKNYINNTSLSF
ncbi:mast cell protease 1A-like isoform X1 [Anguilla rostrata]|uniref:mast cell protease 1A-like isoform X1 n=1 Tax=Anguilla rostrata TaxID=7938 RepID=UPI0030CD5734